MGRWLLSWQFTAILVVLAAAMSVGEFVDTHVEGGRRQRWWVTRRCRVMVGPEAHEGRRRAEEGVSGG